MSSTKTSIKSSTYKSLTDMAICATIIYSAAYCSFLAHNSQQYSSTLENKHMARKNKPKATYTTALHRVYAIDSNGSNTLVYYDWKANASQKKWTTRNARTGGAFYWNVPNTEDGNAAFAKLAEQLDKEEITNTDSGIKLDPPVVFEVSYKTADRGEFKEEHCWRFITRITPKPEPSLAEELFDFDN
jgi:hypothetical protein